MTLTVILIAVALFASQGIYRNWNRTTFDAMPPHLDEAHEWTGKDDDDHWYTRWRKKVKGWFAFGPLSHYRWARFREYPTTLLAYRGPGKWRFEVETGAYTTGDGRFFSSVHWNAHFIYLSRVQYYNDWHIALEWPLFLHGHFGQWQFYIGFKRDADRIYWLSLYIGRTWK